MDKTSNLLAVQCYGKPFPALSRIEMQGVAEYAEGLGLIVLSRLIRQIARRL